MPAFDPRPVVLTGHHVRLDPLQPGHAGAVRVQLKTDERNEHSRRASLPLRLTAGPDLVEIPFYR